MSLRGNAARVLIPGSTWAQIAKQKGGFWDKYSDLNTKIGIKEIRAQQELALKNLLANTYDNFNKQGEKYQQLYDFLFSAEGKFGSIEEKARDTAIKTAIENTFNSISVIKDIHYSKKNAPGEYINLKNNLRNIINSIQKFSVNLTQDQSTGELAISGTYINELLNLFKQYNGTISKTAIYEMIKNINNLQGEILEEMATAFFNSRIPKNCKVKAISVGQARGPDGQFISDILMVNLSAVNLDSIMIEYTLKDEKHTEPLSQFINTLETYSGRKQIKLDADNYGKLLDVSLGGIQAKSGKNQSPWNQNKRHEVALNELGDPSNSMLSQFVDLYNKDSTMIKDAAPLYQMVGNFGLGNESILAKLLDINQKDSSKGNLMLVTQDGFVSYGDRMLQLLKDKGTRRSLMFRFSTIYLSGGMSAAYDVKGTMDD